MSKIEEGARVKVKHDPEREPSVRMKIGQAVDNVNRALDEERAAHRAAVEAARNETTLARADLEALQAAVCGLTGKDGTVADMASALADVGRSRDVAMVAALRRDRDDALRREARAVDTLVTARELFIALRAAVQSERSWAASLPEWERLASALRGEKATQEPESNPAHIAGPWIEVAAGEWRRRDERKSLLFAASISERNDRVLEWSAYPPDFDPPTVSAARDTALDLPAAKKACDAASRRTGWTLRDSEPAKDSQTSIEALRATVESLSSEVTALKQQLAEVQDPAWFTARFREHMRPKPVEARPIATDGCDGGHPGCPKCDAANEAVDPPRVSWRWADGATAGWLTTVTGEQIAGAHEGNGGWYWWALKPQGGTTDHVGPMTERAAVESAEAAARIQGAVIVR